MNKFFRKEIKNYRSTFAGQLGGDFYFDKLLCLRQSFWVRRNDIVFVKLVCSSF